MKKSFGFLLILTACSPNSNRKFIFSSHSNCENTFVCQDAQSDFQQSILNASAAPMLNSVRDEFLSDATIEYKNSKSSLSYSQYDVYMDLNKNQSTDKITFDLGNGYLNEKKRLDLERAKYDDYKAYADYGKITVNAVTNTVTSAVPLPLATSVGSAINGAVDLAHLYATNQFTESQARLKEESLSLSVTVLHDALGKNADKIIADYQKEYSMAANAQAAEKVAIDFLNKFENKLAPKDLDANSKAEAQIQYHQFMLKGALAMMAGQDVKREQNAKEAKKAMERMSTEVAAVQIKMNEGVILLGDATKQMRDGVDGLSTNIKDLKNMAVKNDGDKKRRDQMVQNGINYMNQVMFGNMSDGDKLSALNDPKALHALGFPEEKIQSMKLNLQNILEAKEKEKKFHDVMEKFSSAIKIGKMIGVDEKVLGQADKAYNVILAGKSFYDAYKVFKTAESFSNFTKMAGAAGKLVGMFKGSGGIALDPDQARHQQIMGQLKAIDDKLNKILENLAAMDEKLNKIMESQRTILLSLNEINRRLIDLQYSSEYHFSVIERKLDFNTTLQVEDLHKQITKCYELKDHYRYDFLSPLVIRGDEYRFKQSSLGFLHKMKSNFIEECHDAMKQIYQPKYEIDARTEESYYLLRSDDFLSEDKTIETHNANWNLLRTELLSIQNDLRIKSNNMELSLVPYLLSPSLDMINYFEKLSVLSKNIRENTKSSEDLNIRYNKMLEQQKLYSPRAVIAGGDLLLNDNQISQYHIAQKYGKKEYSNSYTNDMNYIYDMNIEALRSINLTILQMGSKTGEIFFPFFEQDLTSLNWVNELQSLEKKDGRESISDEGVRNIAQKLSAHYCSNESLNNTSSVRYCILNRMPQIRKQFIQYLVMKSIYSTRIFKLANKGLVNLTDGELNYLKNFNYQVYLTNRYQSALENGNEENFPLMVSLDKNTIIPATQYELRNDNRAELILKFATAIKEENCTVVSQRNELPVCMKESNDIRTWYAFIGGVWTEFPAADFMFKAIGEGKEIPLLRHNPYMTVLIELRNRVQSNLMEMNGTMTKNNIWNGIVGGLLVNQSLNSKK